MYTSLVSFFNSVNGQLLLAASRREKKGAHRRTLCPNEVLKMSADMTFVYFFFIGDVVKIVLLTIQLIYFFKKR